MAKDADKIVVATNGSVYLAAVGTTGPTDFASGLNAGFVDYGYIDENGVTCTLSKSVFTVPSWQSPYPVRTIVTDRTLKAQFTLLEWKELTTELAFGGSTGNLVQVITLTGFAATDAFYLTYGGAEGATQFVRGTNATAAAIEAALRTATGDTGLTVTGTTDEGPFTVTFTGTGVTAAPTALTVTNPTGCTGAVTSTAHVIFQPDSDDVQTFACVIDWEDGSKGYRLYMPRVTTVDDAEFKLSRKEATGLPVTLEASQDADTDFGWKFFSSDSSLEETTE